METQLIVQTTKVRKNGYIVTELFKGECLGVYFHKGTLKSLKNCVMINHRIKE